MKNLFKGKIALFMAILVLGFSTVTYAANLGIDFTGPVTGTNRSYSIGYEFNVISPITLTGLAFFGRELSQAHDVGVWDSSGNLIASGTVTNADPLIGTAPFHWTTLSNQVILNIGINYRVAGVSLDEVYAWSPGTFFVDPRIEYVTDRWTASSTLVYPVNTEGRTVGNPGIWGGNIVLETTAVPEPATMLLLGSGLLGLWGARKKFKK